jgi:hypothetical protein
MFHKYRIGEKPRGKIEQQYLNFGLKLFLYVGLMVLRISLKFECEEMFSS